MDWWPIYKGPVYDRLRLRISARAFKRFWFKTGFWSIYFQRGKKPKILKCWITSMFPCWFWDWKNFCSLQRLDKIPDKSINGKLISSSWLISKHVTTYVSPQTTGQMTRWLQAQWPHDKTTRWPQSQWPDDQVTTKSRAKWPHDHRLNDQMIKWPQTHGPNDHMTTSYHTTAKQKYPRSHKII